jgi:hypothetical protein
MKHFFQVGMPNMLTLWSRRAWRSFLSVFCSCWGECCGHSAAFEPLQGILDTSIVICSITGISFGTLNSSYVESVACSTRDNQPAIYASQATSAFLNVFLMWRCTLSRVSGLHSIVRGRILEIECTIHWGFRRLVERIPAKKCLIYVVSLHRCPWCWRH